MQPPGLEGEAMRVAVVGETGELGSPEGVRAVVDAANGRPTLRSAPDRVRLPDDQEAR
jgi:hypothetical protein